MAIKISLWADAKPAVVFKNVYNTWAHSTLKTNIENLSEIHHQLIAHVFNTHFVSLRAFIIYEVIGLRRLSTNSVETVGSA